MMPETLNPWDELVEPATRTPRSLETRENSERKRTWSAPSTLPEIQPRDGWSHKWVRTDIRGVADKPTYGKRLREGWEPIDIADYPELNSFAEGRTSGKVEVGGLIACRMPSEMVSDRNKYYRGISQQQESSAEEHYMRDSNELVKKIASNSRRVVFGQNVR